MSWKLKFRFGNPYLVLKTPLSPAPILHDYAHWIRPATKPSYQPKKVGNRPTWVETSFKAQCLQLGPSVTMRSGREPCWEVDRPGGTLILVVLCFLLIKLIKRPAR